MNRLLLSGLTIIGVINLAPMLPPAHKLTIVVSPTNIRSLTFAWESPTNAPVTGNILSWGTNSSVYLWKTNVGPTSSYHLFYERVKFRSYYFVIQATNLLAISGYSGEVRYPPLPAPPWTALEIYWDTVRFVRVEVSTNLFHWSTYTNVVGTNVIIPKQPINQFFRTVTTNQPPITNHTHHLLL